ncbi:unnamed protein product [Bursaphelenchus okinawaensis]|uniref:OCEL domain-containing protein n=1 Tax=Bursaphelenchus okinawaensis TaxID=465554 RepID=A0A811LM56_9BILA|nr:unnamed protein product [Bursaphelenchus okinawaensis]CAG9124627.1 unnamed protein product [Bursaphelenchus okinawaensis]
METSGSRSTLPTSEPRSTTLTSEGRTAKNSNSKPKTITSEAKSTTVTSEARRPSSITSESRATMTTSEAKSTAINPEDRPTTETSEARPNTINTEKSTIRALTSKIACSTDWNYVFTEIKNDKKCKLYTDLFENAYPVYIEYNNMLTKVYDEFAELKKAYKNAEPEDKVEKYVKLQQLHERYESDADFYKCRQDHHELHSKLEALRKRIVEYNQKQ